MKSALETLESFSQTLYKVAKSDRHNIVVVSGVMGSGKSCFMTKLAQAYSNVSKTAFNYQDNITWERGELADWIDGDEDGKKQKEEYTSIIADELISMINRRNWYKSGQKGVIELLNKCRDRHLLLEGAVPVFDNLDGMFKDIVSFWIFIPKRGVAWVFKPEINPFSKDVWNLTENHKLMRRKGVPYQSYNFVCEIKFDDWTAEEKKQYLAVRNTKRINTENQDEKKNIKVHSSVRQRNDLIKYMVINNILKAKEVAELLGFKPEYIYNIVAGRNDGH